LAEFLGAGNFIISGPRKFGQVLYNRVWCSLQRGAGNSEYLEFPGVSKLWCTLQ
jgi:hypothetical protein